MAGGELMITAVEKYLAVRRAAGFTLSNTEYLLRSFAAFAADQKQTHTRGVRLLRPDHQSSIRRP
jgi:hypothetical protein